MKSAAFGEGRSIGGLTTALNSGAYKELRQSLLAAALGIGALEKTLSENYLDPPDTNYTVLAQVVAPAVTPLAASADITQSEADAYNLWQTNLSQSAGFGTALTTSLNREQGAVTAGSSYWEAAQMSAAVRFEARLAAFLDQEPALRSNVVAQFQADGFPGIMVTTNDAIDLQVQMITNGLPADLLDALTALGVDPGTITNIQYTLLTADPGSMAGGFPGGLVNTNLDSTARTLAADLRGASLMLINASVLPGGNSASICPRSQDTPTPFSSVKTWLIRQVGRRSSPPMPPRPCCRLPTRLPRAHRPVFTGRRTIEPLGQGVKSS